MTKEDIKELVSKVPELDYASFPNPIHGAEVDKYCYIVYKEGLTTNEYLSSTGEVVRGVTRTTTKYGLTTYLQNGYTYLGTGILHKNIQ